MALPLTCDDVMTVSTVLLSRLETKTDSRQSVNYQWRTHLQCKRQTLTVILLFWHLNRFCGESLELASSHSSQGCINCPDLGLDILGQCLGLEIFLSNWYHHWLVAWHSGRMLVFDRRTFPVLCSTCSWRVTTYVGKPSAVGQPTRPTQPFILSG